MGNYGYLPGQASNQPRNSEMPSLPHTPTTPTADPADCDRLAASPDDLRLDRRIVAEHVKDPAAAIKACDAALNLPNRDSARLYFQRGRAHKALDENEAAESDFEAAARGGYAPAEAMLAMANLVSRVTDSVQKRAAAAHLAELQSQSALARYFIGTAECSGAYDKYGILKNKEFARRDIEAAAALGVEDAKFDHCD
jgi:hypothetical protein